MRRVRFLICLIFVIACALFGSYLVKTKMVEDNKPPVITCEEDAITISVKDEDTKLLEGIHAKDNRDGDITDSVRVSSMSHFVKGKRTVTYAVFDRANNVGTLERTVKYSDYRAPRIYLEKPLRFIISASGELDISEYYTADDCLDGDLTSQVRVLMNENYYYMQEGIHEVTLQVNNSAGDVCSIPMEMQIAYNDNDDERAKEYPTLSDYIVYTSLNKEIKESKYLTGISRNNVEYEFDEISTVSKSDVRIESNVDYSKPGIYTVEYSYKAEGAKRAITKMYVVVEGKESGKK